MRRISANYIFPVNQPPLKNGIVELDDQGKITDIIDTGGKLVESRNLEFYNGVITSGFVNAHCHLELSYLKNALQTKIGLPRFLSEIVQYKKEENKDKITRAMVLFDNLMKQEGIVAVGDIANTENSIEVKEKSKIYYHTFVELLGLGENYEKIFSYNLKILEAFQRRKLEASLVPHAPYSVSDKLLEKIKAFAEKHRSVLSIHNQESEGENLMFQNKQGELVNTLQNMGIDLSKWLPTGKSSVNSVLERLPNNNNIIFVHNTYSTKEDIERVHKHTKNAYWCLCPLSNLYIENTLPDFSLFTHLHDQVVLGTDSLASNERLSILEEMKTIAENSPDIEFEKLLKWATLNGSKALQVENKFGSLEKGKSPGINLINHFDFERMQLTGKSEVKVLV